MVFRSSRAARCIVTALLLCFASANASGEPPRHIDVIAHRGAHDEFPENTLGAMRAAIAIGCEYVEVDVRETSDGRLVLMHDGTVDRTTTGSGAVHEMTFDEVRRLRFGDRWPDERVPTFDETLEVCKGRIKVYIDHKRAPPERVVELVKKHQMISDAIVYGDVETLREYKRLAPKLWIMPPHPESAAGIRELVADLHPETLDGNIIEWTAEHVQTAHALGVLVAVDNPPQLDNEPGVRAAVTLGVDALQTDHPKRVIRMLETLGARRAREVKTEARAASP